MSLVRSFGRFVAARLRPLFRLEGNILFFEYDIYQLGYNAMSIDKKYLKSRPVCKVKFVAPPELSKEAKQIYLAGDFNNWDYEDTVLKRQKNGTYAATLELEAGLEYQYRYVLDGERWENDYEADKYVPSNVCDAENSVVVV